MIKDVSFIIIFFKNMAFGGFTYNGRECGGKGRLK